MGRQDLEQRVTRTAEAVLARQKYVSAIDVLLGLGWLAPSETDYVARTRDRRRLRFSVSGDADIERAYRTHWVSPELSERAIARQSRPPDLVVISPVNEWTCTSCGGTDDLTFSSRRRWPRPSAARQQVRGDVEDLLAEWRAGLGIVSG